VPLKDGSSLTIGLKQVTELDRQTYVDSVHETFHDLAISLGKESKKENTEKLIYSIKNLTSDQCATNKVFNDSIGKNRKTLLPAIIKNFDSFTVEQKLA